MREIIEIHMSAFNKTLIFQKDGKAYDISKEVPESVWEIGRKNFYNPVDDWKMRIELRKIFIEYFKQNIDANLDENDVVF